MDELAALRQYKERLRTYKESLEREINERYKEVDSIKVDAFGIGAKLKELAMRQLTRRSEDLEAVMGSAIYEKARNKEIHDAQDYIDDLRESISRLRDAISNADSVLKNIEHCESNLSNALRELKTWTDRADDLLRR